MHPHQRCGSGKGECGSAHGRPDLARRPAISSDMKGKRRGWGREGEEPYLCTGNLFWACHEPLLLHDGRRRRRPDGRREGRAIGAREGGHLQVARWERSGGGLDLDAQSSQLCWCISNTILLHKILPLLHKCFYTIVFYFQEWTVVNHLYKHYIYCSLQTMSRTRFLGVVDLIKPSLKKLFFQRQLT